MVFCSGEEVALPDQLTLLRVHFEVEKEYIKSTCGQTDLSVFFFFFFFKKGSVPVLTALGWCRVLLILSSYIFLLIHSSTVINITIILKFYGTQIR